MAYIIWYSHLSGAPGYHNNKPQNNAQRKRFTAGRFKELILENAEKNPDEQKLAFDKALDAHKLDQKQRDDITVIGVQL